MSARFVRVSHDTKSLPDGCVGARDRSRPFRLGIALIAAAAGLGIFVADSSHADETPIPEIEHPQPVDFQREVLPILRKKCLACHNGTTAESDLVLETPETIRKGGLSGPAVVPHSPDESHLLVLASHRDEPVMPPEDNEAGAERMTGPELALIKLWIEQGAEGTVSASGERIDWQPLPLQINPVFAVAQSPDGRFVAVGRANQASVYDVALGEYVGLLADPSLAELPAAAGRPIAHLDLVQSLAFSPDGQWIASGGYRTLKLWRRTPPLELFGELNASPSVATVHGGAQYLVDDAGQMHVVTADGATAAGQDLDLVDGIDLLAVSPDGKRWAMVNGDGQLRIAVAGAESIAAAPLSGRILQLAWIDSERLAAACDDHRVRLWTVDGDGRSGEPRELVGHDAPVMAIAVVGSSALASATGDGRIRLWDVESGQTKRQWEHGAPIRGLASSPASGRLVSFGPDTGAKLWNTESGESVAELNVDRDLQWEHQRCELAQRVAQRHVDNVNQDIEAAKKRIEEEEQNLKKDQETLAKAKEEFEKSTAAAEEAERQKQQAQETLDAVKAKLVEAERALADAAEDEAKQAAATQVEATKKEIADAEANLKTKAEEAEKVAKQLAEHRESFDAATRSVTISEQVVADARAAAEPLEARLQEAQQQLAARQEATQAAAGRVDSERHAPQAVAFSPNGKLIASVDGQGRSALWRSDDGRPIQIVSLPAGEIRSLAFASDRSLTAVSADGRMFKLPSTPQWQLVRTIGTPDGTSILADRVTALSFSPDGKLLAVGGGEPSRSGELKIFQVDDGALVREIADAHSDTIFGLAFSPDGRQLASCGADRFMKVFDVDSGELVRAFEGHTHHVLSVDWRADGRVLATGGADSVVKLWNAADGSQVRTIQGFGKEVTSVEFAGAEDHFYAACGDGQLYRCNMEGERKSIGSSSDFLYVVSTCALGKSIAFGGHDGIVRIVDDNGASKAEVKPE